jgi:hypothetical protein
MAGKLCAFIIDGRECRRAMAEESRGDLIALRIFQCSLGHRCYQTVAAIEIRFRQTLKGDTWHFSEDCSQWPSTNFFSVNYISSEATICNECLAKSAHRGKRWLTRKRHRSRFKSFSFPASPKPMRWRNSSSRSGIITQQEFLQKISEERATYQRMFKPTRNDD